jgi:hypothetical protein
MPEDTIQPPTPPEVERRLRLHRTQAIGIPLLLLLALLGLLGVLGPATDEVVVEEAGWRVSVEWPDRLRYGQRGRIHVRAASTAGTAGTVRVRVEPAYLAGFEDVAATPALDHDMAWPAAELEAGAAATFLVEFVPRRPGLRRGTLEIEGDGVARRIRFSTLIFP